MSDSILEISHANADTIIISFGGCKSKLGGILPFECLRSLQDWFPRVDLKFIIDKNFAHYHKGIDGVSTNIDDTINFIRNKILGYKKVIFVGISAGGYAAILFGSLLNVNHVVAFVPQTILNKAYANKYTNLAPLINKTTDYKIYGDTAVTDISDNHHQSHVRNIDNFKNVHAIYIYGISLPRMRDSGKLRAIISSCINS